MDINPQSTKPISDDAELAKVLAGVNQQTDEALQFDTPPVMPTPTTPPSDTPATDTPAMPTTDTPSDTAHDDALPEPSMPKTEEPSTPPVAPVEESPMPAPAPTMSTNGSNDLSSIKKDALNDLRPLVGKLDIAPEEKFDTYLLLIRSTDDKTLIEPAYAAAQAIADESRKAQALLDVIKEIDYLSNPPQ